MCHFKNLQEKKICVDVSNYMYKFAAEDSLLPLMSQFLTLMQNHHIQPLFVFDGKPPIEKRDLLQKRRQERREARLQYEEEMGHIGEDRDEKRLMECKRKATSLSMDDIDAVRKLIETFGYKCIDASAEADEECAILVKKGTVWGCMSEDMDFFVYGCNHIVRKVNIQDSSIVLYNVPSILRDLDLTQDELREICVLSGTDYNTDIQDRFHLFKTIKLYKKYKKSFQKGRGLNGMGLTFYEWLKEKMNYNINLSILNNINHMFII